MFYTEYLPIKDEIRPRDIIRSTMTSGHPIGPNEAVHMRLFLCAKNIEVGDTIWRVYFPSNLRRSKILKQRADTLVKLEGYFEWFDLSKLIEIGFVKIIGEVSPLATWVQEGMEFQWEDVSPDHVHDEETGKIIYKSTIGRQFGVVLFLNKDTGKYE